MNSFKIITLSFALVSTSFAIPSNSVASADVVQLAPVVVEATRLPSAADLTRPGLDQLKAEGSNAPARLRVSLPLAAAAVREPTTLAARTSPGPFAKPATVRASRSAL